MESLLEETASRILADYADAPESLWSALEENGLTRVWVREPDGGFDMSPGDGFGLMRLTGTHATSVPLAETLIATWFLTEAGLPVPPGPMSFVIDGVQIRATFGDRAEHIVCVRERSVSLHHGHIEDRTGGVGADPMSDAARLTEDAVERGEIPFDTALPFAALARASQICGALDAALDLTIAFAEEREQFGRPISKFQAIQHLLSEMGAEAAAARAVLDVAVANVRRHSALDLATIAAAKYRACVAAGIVSEHAHQVHGAIGYTQEYGLAQFTRRLWQWREDFGGETYWASKLGHMALDDLQPLWPRLTVPIDGEADSFS